MKRQLCSVARIGACVLVIECFVSPSLGAGRQRPEPADTRSAQRVAGVAGSAAAGSFIEIADFCSLAQIRVDISDCAQNAIAAAAASSNASRGGGIVHFPANLGPYIVRRSIVVDKNFVGLVGDGPQASYIQCANGAGDCVVLGDEKTPTRDLSLENLAINGDGAKTGGANVSVRNTFNLRAERLQVEYCVRCFDIGPGNNSITLRDVILTVDQRASDYGLYWHAPGDGSMRSDVLTLHNVVIEGHWSDATGLMWEGFANTLVATHLRILHSKYGLRVANPAHSASFFPSFLNAFDLEMEGFKTRALTIDGGSDFKIVGSDINNLSGAAEQGGADDVAVRIASDAGASYTRGVSIVGTRIGGSASSGLVSDSRDLQLSNVIFYSTSGSAAGAAPVMRLGAATYDAILDNIHCEEFGGLARASYCLEIDRGANGVLASNINARYVRRGAIADRGGVGVSVVNVIEPGGGVDASSAQRRQKSAAGADNVEKPMVADCGAQPSLSSGASDAHGSVTIGAGAPGACQITFVTPYARSPDCVVASPSGGAVSYAATAKDLVVRFAPGALQTIAWFCAPG